MKGARAITYCRDGALRIFGVYNSSLGKIPFAVKVRLEGDVPDGPVDVANPPEVVESALTRAERGAMAQINAEEMKLGAADIVERARAGDQVAMATLQLVGQESQKGNSRAKRAHKLLSSYIKKNPPPAVSFGREGVRPLDRTNVALNASFAKSLAAADMSDWAAGIITFLPIMQWAGIVRLSHGPTLKDEHHQAIATLLGRKSGLYDYAVANAHSPKALTGATSKKARQTVYLGYAIGTAMRLQDVRRPNSRISDFDQTTGWELGE